MKCVHSFNVVAISGNIYIVTYMYSQYVSIVTFVWNGGMFKKMLMVKVADAGWGGGGGVI